MSSFVKAAVERLTLDNNCDVSKWAEVVHFLCYSHRSKGLPDWAFKSLVKELLQILHSDNPALKAFAVNALRKLGVDSKEALSKSLKLSMDTDVSGLI